MLHIFGKAFGYVTMTLNILITVMKV